MGQDLATGYTYTPAAPNNTVTAGNLNQAVNAAALQPTAISARTEKTAPTGDDAILLWDSADSTLKRAFLRNTALSTGTGGIDNAFLQADGTLSIARLFFNRASLINPLNNRNVVAQAGGYMTLDLATTGVNGWYDPGVTIPNDVWVGVFLIADGNGAVGCFGTTNFSNNDVTGVALPPGYPYVAFYGYVFWQSGGTIRRIDQRGRVSSQQPIPILRGVQAPTANAWYGADPRLAGYNAAPSAIQSLRGVVGTTGPVDLNVRLGSDGLSGAPGPSDGVFFAQAHCAAACQGLYACAAFELFAQPLNGGIVWWQLPDTTTQIAIRINGFSF